MNRIFCCQQLLLCTQRLSRSTQLRPAAARLQALAFAPAAAGSRPGSSGTVSAAIAHSSSRPFSVLCEPAPLSGQGMSLLPGEGDVYDGVKVDAAQLPNDPAEFAESLQHSLQAWRAADRKGIWLKLPLDKAALVPEATQQGFYFHHAERDYVMLAQWLPDTEDKLPANASHQVGIGAFVYDRQRQRVLMVQEKNGPLKGKGVWKMPTGLSMAREDIADAAQREVFEETGVKAQFRDVIAFRQAHTALFDKSDLFVVVALEPQTTEITIQDDELVAAEWQSLAEFETNPFPATYPLLAKIVERCLAYALGDYSGLTTQRFETRGRVDSLTFGPSSVSGHGSSL